MKVPEVLQPYRKLLQLHHHDFSRDVDTYVEYLDAKIVYLGEDNAFYSQEKFDELRRRHKAVRKFKNHELQELLNEIKSHISR